MACRLVHIWASSHFLIQCWNIVNLTLGTNFSEIVISILIDFHSRKYNWNVLCKKAAILARPPCVKHFGAVTARVRTSRSVFIFNEALSVEIVIKMSFSKHWPFMPPPLWVNNSLLYTIMAYKSYYLSYPYAKNISKKPHLTGENTVGLIISDINCMPKMNFI